MIDIQLFSLQNNKIIPSINLNATVKNETALAQRIIKLLLTIKGSDYFNSSLGSSLLSFYGTYNEDMIDNLKLAISVMLDSFSDNIKYEQLIDISNGITYSDFDLLEKILVNSIQFNTLSAGWEIELQIINKAQTSVVIKV